MKHLSHDQAYNMAIVKRLHDDMESNNLEFTSTQDESERRKLRTIAQYARSVLSLAD